MNKSSREPNIGIAIGSTTENASTVLPISKALDRSLLELQSGRRLEKVTASIESFLLNQVSRLNESLGQCQLAVHQDQIVQRIMADFELQKEAWEKERQAEIQRLFEASEKLIEGWKQLEDERQAWLDQRS